MFSGSLKSHDVICAVATPPGIGAIGIVRLSGHELGPYIYALCNQKLRPREASLTNFHDQNGAILDQGLAIFFPKPYSYTGEDVLELHLHGNPFILDSVLNRLLNLGARLADPGEFTLRAFLSGKMDLAQAESVADLIEASSMAAVRAAQKTLHGEFSQKINAIAESLLQLRAVVEASLDFSEEAIEPESDQWAIKLHGLIDTLQTLMCCANQGVILQEGVMVVIAGPPNAGKSSLLNCLAHDDLAIVTPIAGTTRDSIRAQINFAGLSLEIVDTAGIRKPTDAVEAIGIEKSKALLHRANIVLWVTEASLPLDMGFKENLTHEQKIILVRNKIDTHNIQAGAGIEEDLPVVYLSAKTGEGLKNLENELKALAPKHEKGVFIARRRELQSLQKAKNFLEEGQEVVEAPELLGEFLALAHHALGEITGKVTADDMLGEIFSRFCIGK